MKHYSHLCVFSVLYFFYHCLLDLISKFLEFWLLMDSAQICQLSFLLGMNTHSFPTTSCFNSNLPIFHLGDVPANFQMSGLVWLLVGTWPFLCLSAGSNYSCFSHIQNTFTFFPGLPKLTVMAPVSWCTWGQEADEAPWSHSASWFRDLWTKKTKLSVSNPQCNGKSGTGWWQQTFLFKKMRKLVAHSGHWFSPGEVKVLYTEG